MEQHTVVFSESEMPIAWPVSWSAVWVGALAALAAITMFGLLETALGITALADVKDFSTWKSLSLIDTVAAIFGAFLAFVIGGWVTGKIAGFCRAEPAILHAAISWLLAVPMLLAFLALGMGKTFGGWYGGLVGSSPWVTASVAAPSPETVRHFAIAAVTALLLGLMGAVIGGWMACGEPMSITHYRKRGSMNRNVTGG
jgi:hypothetical protein